MTPRRQGDLGELSAMEWLAGLGACIYVPVGQSPDVDLVALLEGRLIGIEVKTTVCKPGPTWQVALATRGGNQSWSGVVKRFERERCDFLFAHAADQVVRTDELRVVKLFSQTLMIMAKGEIRQDMAAYDSRQTIRDYLARINGKTASLFSTACEGGAIVAGEPETYVQALRDYGYNFGMAFQVVDDILDFAGDPEAMGKPVGSDLMQGTLTLPSFLLMERMPESNAITRYFEDPSDTALAAAVAAVMDSGCIDESSTMARDFSRRAIEALAPLPDNADRRTLSELAEYILERRS